MRTKLLVLLFCWVGMVGIKSGNACGKDKDENAVVLPVYEPSRYKTRHPVSE